MTEEKRSREELFDSIAKKADRISCEIDFITKELDSVRIALKKMTSDDIVIDAVSDFFTVSSGSEYKYALYWHGTGEKPDLVIRCYDEVSGHFFEKIENVSADILALAVKHIDELLSDFDKKLSGIVDRMFGDVEMGLDEAILKAGKQEEC